MSRVLLIPLVLLLLLLLGAVLVVPALLNQDRVLKMAAAAVHEHTGATLTVHGDAKLSVLPALGITLSDVAIAPPENSQSDLRDLRDLQVGTLKLGVRFLPLLQRRFEIDTIVLDKVRVSIESGSGQSKPDTGALSDEDLDALYAIRRKRMATSAEATGTEAVLRMPLALHVKKLTITDARLELLDAGGAVPKVIELVRLDASDLSLDGAPIAIDLALRVPGKQVIDVAVKGAIRIDQQHQSVTLEQLDITATGVLANALQLRTNGVVDLNRQSADLQLALTLGATRGNGTLRYASFESPQIDSVLQFNLLDPALLALAGPDAVALAGNESTAVSGDQSLPLDALRAIDAHTVVTIEQARFGAHTVNNMQAKLLALDGLIQVTALSGDLHGGKLKASGTLNGKHNAVTLETSGSLNRLDIATVLSATESKLAATGNATLNWELHSQGNSENALTAALHGPIKFTTEEVVVKDVGVEQLLCQTVALSNREQLTATFPVDTRFTTLAADIQVAAGKATLTPLRAELSGVALSGSGNYDLLSKNFDAALKARLSPELEQLDHACRISKRLLAIDLPINCSGSVGTEPAQWCRVDATKIVQDLTVNEGLEKLEKKASRFLDKLLNKGD